MRRTREARAVSAEEAHSAVQALRLLEEQGQHKNHTLARRQRAARTLAEQRGRPAQAAGEGRAASGTPRERAPPCLGEHLARTLSTPATAATSSFGPNSNASSSFSRRWTSC